MTAQGVQATSWVRGISAVALAAGSAVAIVYAASALMQPDVGAHALHVTHLAVAVAALVIAEGLFFYPKHRWTLTWGTAGLILAFPLGRLLGIYLYLPAEAMDDVFLVAQVLLGTVLSAIVLWILKRPPSIEQPLVGTEPEIAAAASIPETVSQIAEPEPETGIQPKPPKAEYEPLTTAKGGLPRFDVASGALAWARGMASPRLIGAGAAALALVGCIFFAASLFRSGGGTGDLAGEFAACDVSIRNGGWHISASPRFSSVKLDKMRNENAINFEHEGLGGYKSTLRADISIYAGAKNDVATSFYLDKDGEQANYEISDAYAIFNNRAQDELVLRGTTSGGLFVFPDSARRLVDFVARSGREDERIQGVYFMNDNPVAQVFFSPIGLQAAHKKAGVEHDRIAKLVSSGACSENKLASAPSGSQEGRDSDTPRPEAAKPEAAAMPAEKPMFADFDSVDRFIATALKNEDKTVSVTPPDPYNGFLALIRVNGKPVATFMRAEKGRNGVITSFTAVCKPDGMLALSFVVYDWDSKAGSLDTNASYALSLAGGSYDLPVTITKQFMNDTELFARVEGQAKASDPFFMNLAPTLKFHNQLKKDGRLQDIWAGMDLSAGEQYLKPLIHNCAGSDAVAAAKKDERTRSGILPSAEDVKGAMRREIDRRLARLDAMGDQCNTFKEQNNPIGAIMCLATGGGALSSKSVQFHINNVAIDYCTIADDGNAYCRYRADGRLDGTGIMGQVAGPMNSLMALNQWSYSSFTRSGGQWEWVKTYDSCDFTDGRIRCRWTERR